MNNNNFFNQAPNSGLSYAQQNDPDNIEWDKIVAQIDSERSDDKKSVDIAAKQKWTDIVTQIESERARETEWDKIVAQIEEERRPATMINPNSIQSPNFFNTFLRDDEQSTTQASPTILNDFFKK